jgi:hypothetical protein
MVVKPRTIWSASFSIRKYCNFSCCDEKTVACPKNTCLRYAVIDLTGRTQLRPMTDKFTSTSRNYLQITSICFRAGRCLLPVWRLTEHSVILRCYRWPSPYHGEEVWAHQWRGELCWWECKLLVRPSMKNRSKDICQMKSSPWSSEFGVRRVVNDRIQEEFTVTKLWGSSRLTQCCSLSKNTNFQ